MKNAYQQYLQTYVTSLHEVRDFIITTDLKTNEVLISVNGQTMRIPTELIHYVGALLLDIDMKLMLMSR